MTMRHPVPRITEAFVDSLIFSIGGRRLTNEEKGKDSQNADYLNEEAVIELKIIEEEGLLKTERQEKITPYLLSTLSESNDGTLDVKNLPDDKKRKYYDIIGNPLKGAIKKAGKQIKATKSILSQGNSSGVLIIVNNGYGSLDSQEFEKLSHRFATKDTSQIDLLVCASTRFVTNSFDFTVIPSVTSFEITPRGNLLSFKAFEEKWYNAFETALTNGLRGSPPEHFLNPLQDITWNFGGVQFTLKAPTIPDSRFSR
jgi:hypothetical protein